MMKDDYKTYMRSVQAADTLKPRNMRNRNGDQKSQSVINMPPP